MILIIHNQYPFYSKQRQVKMEWGVSKREGEREKERSGLREWEMVPRR